MSKGLAVNCRWTEPRPGYSNQLLVKCPKHGTDVFEKCHFSFEIFARPKIMSTNWLKWTILFKRILSFICIGSVILSHAITKWTKHRRFLWTRAIKYVRIQEMNVHIWMVRLNRSENRFQTCHHSEFNLTFELKFGLKFGLKFSLKFDWIICEYTNPSACNVTLMTKYEIICKKTSLLAKLLAKISKSTWKSVWFFEFLYRKSWFSVHES